MDFKNRENVCYCLRNEASEVIEQNDPCIQLCGELKGKKCRQGCMELFHKKSLPNQHRTGFHFHQKKEIFGKRHDVFIYAADQQYVTLLHPSEDHSLAQKESAHIQRLTPREKEIHQLFFIEGYTHKQICSKLFIRLSTLKTHINNINKKSFSPPQV